MNIIVTKKRIDYRGFLKLSTLKEVMDTKGTIDFLVYNKSDESSEDRVFYLNQLKDRVSRYIYICNDKDTDIVVKMVVVGLDGKYFDDEEFFLSDERELGNLSNYLDDVAELANAEMGGVSVLQDFFKRYLNNGSTSFNSRYLNVVKESVQCLVDDYHQKSLEILRMSENATEIFSSTAEILSSMRKEHGEMQKAISKLEAEVKKGSIVNTSVLEEYRKTPSLVFFPQVSYMKEKRIIRIKELGNVKYLVSFMLGFRIYLESIRNVRPKLIIVESVGDFIETKYEEYNWITQKKIKDRKVYYNNVVFTNCPNKEVLYGLLDDTEFDTFIVVDRTKNGKAHILNSKGALYYAVSGKSSVDRYKLPIKSVFTGGFELKGSLFDLDSRGGYPIDRSARERFYLSNYTKEYSLLF